MMEEDSQLAIVGGAQVPKGSSLLGRMESEYWNYRKAIGAGGAMYRTEALEDASGFDDELNIGEDGELRSRLVALGWRTTWSGDIHIEHYHAISPQDWFNKMSHGSTAGLSFRGVTRLLASPIIGIHAAWIRGNTNLLWYIPLRSLVLLLGPGKKKEYIPT
jgi:GT2 family glycosyltransferase